MIISFTAKNFKSIKDEITLSFKKVSKKDSNKGVIELPDEPFDLLPTCLIYGPNASGKTNIFRAIEYFRMIVRTSSDNEPDKRIMGYSPFLLNETSSCQNSVFEIEFIKWKTRYRYLVEFNQIEIVKEVLTLFPKTRKKSGVELFRRETGQPITFSGKYLKGGKKSVEAKTLPNMLFLSQHANLGNDQLKPVYDFFLHDMFFHTGPDLNKETLYDESVNLLIKDENSFLNYKEGFISFLRAAGIHIDDIVVFTDQRMYTFDLKEDLPRRLEELHQRHEDARVLFGRNVFSEKETLSDIVYFDLLGSESGGTVKLFNLASRLMSNLGLGSLLVIDEFDCQLHPFLSRYIIDLFNDPKSNKKGAQLLVAAYDASIMDMEGLSRDQIWFTNIDEHSSTQFYSLHNIDKKDVRPESNISKQYLDGQFKAVPKIKQVVSQ